MAEIYAGASFVTIWLGRASYDVRTCLTSLQNFHERMTEQEYQRYHIREASDLLIGNTYWTRMWIVQEVVLAERLILCQGECSLSWTCLTDLLHRLKPMTHRSLTSIMDLKKHPKTTFAGLVSRFPDQSCSDPRDRVYALNSLAIVGRCLTLHVDYDRNVEQVFCDTVYVLTRERYMELENMAKHLWEREDESVILREYRELRQDQEYMNSLQVAREMLRLPRSYKTALADIIAGLRAQMMPEESRNRPLSSSALLEMIEECERLIAAAPKRAMPYSAEIASILSGKIITWMTGSQRT